MRDQISICVRFRLFGKSEPYRITLHPHIRIKTYCISQYCLLVVPLLVDLLEVKMPIPLQPVTCIYIGLYYCWLKRQYHSDLSLASRSVSNAGTYVRALLDAREPSLLAICHEHLDRSQLTEHKRDPSLLANL